VLTVEERKERRKIKARKYVADYRRRHPERLWDVTHPERASEIRKNAPSNTKAARAERMRNWRRNNPERNAATALKGRPVRLKALRDWRQRNKEKMRAACAAYDALKKRALPAWADRSAIEKIYLECPPGMEVDHVIPLRGKLVCGLHVPENLQYLTPAENRSKGNKWHP